MGRITEEPHASVSFLFIYSPCLFFSPDLHTPPSCFLPQSSTHFRFAPFQFLTLPSLYPLLFSSPCLPREKRFCLLLVSAPSQSAFLISSYCFCLIFKCYPRPNGNPYTPPQNKKGGVASKGKRNRLGIVFHCRTLRQKPPTPEGKIWWFWGALGLEDGSELQYEGVTFFFLRHAPLPPPSVNHIIIFLSHFSFYLLSPDLPMRFFNCLF